jgi:beta-glucanase (GH16 family)
MDHRSLNIDMTQWHTWGVIWAPSSITYTLDGRQWAVVTVPSEIPTVRMDLNFELRTMCALGRQCPTSPQSLLVDWATEYVAVNP